MADGGRHHGSAGHEAPGEVVPSLVCPNWSLRRHGDIVDCAERDDRRANYARTKSHCASEGKAIFLASVNADTTSRCVLLVERAILFLKVLVKSIYLADRGVFLTDG